MIPLRLKLINSIGLFDGIGKREIEIDFTKFNRGIVGIFGHTGSGKSTIMENMTPFRKLMTRPGALHDHFMDEGLRELEFEMEGDTYLSRLLIDAPKKKTIAQLYKNGTTEGHLLNDKLEEYDAYVAEVMGEYDLFVNSVFAPQTTDMIITMKDTPMKNLFMMLFNLEKYSNVYLPLLKLRKEDSDKRLQGVKIAFDLLEKDLEEMKSVSEEMGKLKLFLPELKDRVTEGDKALKEHSENILKNKQELTKCTMENESLIDKKKQVSTLQKEIDGMAGEIAKEAEDVEVALKSNQVEIDMSISDKETMDREIGRADKIINNKKLILEKADTLNKLKTKLEIVSSAEKELLVTKDMHDNIIHDIVRLQRDIEILERVPCAGTEYYDKCELLSNAIESKDILVKKENEKDKSDINIIKLSKDKDTADLIRTDIESLNKDNWEQIKTELVLAEKNIVGWKERLAKSEDRIIECAKIKSGLDVRLAGLEKKAIVKTADKKVRKEVLELDIKAIEDSSNIVGIEAEIKRLEYLTHKIENEYNIANNEFISAETRIEEYQKSVELFNRKNNTKETKVKEMNSHIEDLEEWNMIEKFLKEVPVYELESLAQVTTDFANDLLSLYDESFSMKIVTVLPKAGNKGLKEVFKIVIYKSGKEVFAYNLSGGQKQVFDAVLRMGIVLTLNNTQNKKFESSFWDEAASAIDSEYAIKYMEMHERALNISNKHFTFVISHHEKTQGMINQKILIEDL